MIKMAIQWDILIGRFIGSCAIGFGVVYIAYSGKFFMEILCVVTGVFLVWFSHDLEELKKRK